MKSVLVVDDERPVVDHIIRIIERELSGEFSVADTASSGREALDKVPVVQPDIIVMDVRMPGLSGLETIRQLKRRGSSAAFLLSTAYERFDIAREALELGILGYLLKPVGKDALVQALRNAGGQLDRQTDVELQSFRLKEKDTQVKGFVVQAFLDGLVLGRSSGEGVQALKDWLGIDKPWGMVAAAAFLHQPQKGRDALESVLHYKSTALCGPLVADRCLIFVPLAAVEAASEARKELLELVAVSLPAEVAAGSLRIGFSSPRPVADLALAWPEALGDLRASRVASGGAGRFVAGGAFEQEEEFHTALVQGDSDRLRFALESLLVPFEAEADPPVADRYRIISLLGSALCRLVGLGHLDHASAHHWLDFDDLRQAPEGREFCLLVRTRLPVITGALHRAQRLSSWVAGAMDHISRNFAQPVTLDQVATSVGLTPKRLSRLFIDEVGQGFSDYLIDFRIAKAKTLLILPGASIKQVAAACGYPDPNYFARLFKKVTGTTPTEYAASP